jgi:hypothetical protein
MITCSALHDELSFFVVKLCGPALVRCHSITQSTAALGRTRSLVVGRAHSARLTGGANVSWSWLGEAIDSVTGCDCSARNFTLRSEYSFCSAWSSANTALEPPPTPLTLALHATVAVVRCV